jgi:hypothetical protein
LPAGEGPDGASTGARNSGKLFDEWRRQVMRSRIEPTQKIARSLRQHHELMPNYFRAQKLLSSGVVDGRKNKPKSP